STVEFTGTTAQTIAKAGGTETFYNLKINKASNTVTVGPTTNINIIGNGSLNIASGTFDAAGRNITLKSAAPIANMDQTARLSEVLGTFNNATNVTVERYLPVHSSYMTSGATPVSVTYRATMLAPAVSGVIAANWADDIKIIGGPAGSGFAAPNITSYSSISNYSELSGGSSINGGWRYVLQSSTPLYSGNGYRVSAGFRGLNETLSVTGTPVIGSFSKPITYTANGTQGWNLIGNPYPCELNYQTFYNYPANKAAIEAAVYILDPLNNSTTAQNNSYYYYIPTAGPNGLAVESRGTARPATSLKYIASSQAFFVKARNTNPTYNLTFNENMKANGAVYGNFRTENPDLVRIDVSDGSLIDQAVVYFSAGATDTFDPDFDALKIDNANLNISSHAIGGNTEMAINGISEVNDVFIPLKITSKSSKIHSLKVVEFETNKDRKLYIYDKLKNNYYELSSNFNFNFENSGSENLNRFFITNTAKNVVTSLEEESAWGRKMSLSPNPYNGGTLNVIIKSYQSDNASIEITDIKGKTLKTELRTGSIQGNKSIYDIENIVGDLAAGTYIVKYKTQTEFYQQKLVIVK
ncbi:MAG: T9SS type A sorting domain-containing protein, partial [Opitutaceae bacterium]|nr:T9SS type A sorting domain-containing protein [Cytophagales bacterium]